MAEPLYALQIRRFICCFVVGAAIACGGTVQPPTTAESVELCAQALVLSPEVQTQAQKVGREPIEFTRQICGAVILAAQVVRVNVPHVGSAAAGSASVTSTQTAGAAGSS